MNLADPEEYVECTYIAVLGRDGDRGGWQYWSSELGLGHVTRDQLINAFLSSPEYSGRYGVLTNGPFLNFLYQNALLRAPDAGGFNFWKDLLDRGVATRSQVLAAFIASQEFETVRVAQVDTFLRVMHDMPDCSGGLTWAMPLFLATDGTVYAFFQTVVDQGVTYQYYDWFNQVKGARLTAPLRSFGPTDGPQTQSLTPSEVELPKPPSTVSQLGWGQYRLQAVFEATRAGCSPLTASDTQDYPITPSILSLSPSSGVIGNLVNVTASGSGLLTGVTDVRVVGQNGQIPVSLLSQNGNSVTVRLDLRGSTVKAGAYSVSLVALGVPTNSLTFNVYDATPVIDHINPLGTLQAGEQVYVELYGYNFAPSRGSVNVCHAGANPCGSSDVGVQITYWPSQQPNPNLDQVNVLLTAELTASGTYDIQLTSLGSNGTQFSPAPAGQTSGLSNRKQISASPNITVTLSPPQLNLSTGDPDKSITTTVTPSVPFSVVYSAGLASPQPPGSECNPTLSIPDSNGTGSVNTIVQASPSNCSAVFNVLAFANSKPSSNGTLLVVPPQALIWQMTSEADGFTIERDPGGIAQQSVGWVGRNRFTQQGFAGVSTYNGLIASGQVASAKRPPNGVQPQLNNAVAVFTGATGDIVGGAGCYWSPRTTEMPFIQAALDSGTTVFPAYSTTENEPIDGILDPRCYLVAERQIVWKTSMPNNFLSGYQGAPGFLFERRRNTSDPAVVQIP